eukprot:1322148-Amorphochlora_amoeboformis.AAC.1
MDRVGLLGTGLEFGLALVDSVKLKVISIDTVRVRFWVRIRAYGRPNSTAIDKLALIGMGQIS